MKYVVTKYEVIRFTKQIHGCITLKKPVLKLLTRVTVFRLRKTEGGTLVAHRNLACARETGRDRFLDTLGGLWNVPLEYRVRILSQIFQTTFPIFCKRFPALHDPFSYGGYESRRMLVLWKLLSEGVG